MASIKLENKEYKRGEYDRITIPFLSILLASPIFHLLGAAGPLVSFGTFIWGGLRPLF